MALQQEEIEAKTREIPSYIGLAKYSIILVLFD